MESNKILSADLLDILFEGKNKEYGAYELRKTYNSRAGIGLGFTVAIIILFLCSFISNDNSKIEKPPIVDIIDPTAIPNEPKPLLKEQLIPSVPKTKTIANPPPQIVKDILVKDPPAPNKDFDDAQISLHTSDGLNDNNIPTPIEIKGSNVIEAPRKTGNDIDEIVTHVEMTHHFTATGISLFKKKLKNIWMNLLMQANRELVL